MGIEPISLGHLLQSTTTCCTPFSPLRLTVTLTHSLYKELPYDNYRTIELPSGIEPNYLDYKSSASPAMLWKLVVLRTGLEPVSSPVKGECPNQLDERSINNKYKYTKTFPHILIYFHAESIGFEPMHRLLDDSLANCSFNHSGNSPCY